jgi:hypothetical protein
VREAPSPPRATALYRELVRLGEATVGRLREGDEAGLPSAMDERDALLAAIARTSVSPLEAPEIAAAIRRVLALDQEMLALIEGLQAQMSQTLAKIAASRAALGSYRAAPPGSAAYIERLG